ncbi:MAG: ATP-binding protein [Actinomycetota bacterium]|nr:ATP-binding protein [Actinomycetota bacterium]
MPVGTFQWPEVGNFVDRDDQLARLDQWWASTDRQPINLFGRRRVGKSWLFRRFAHGKQAIILVAERGAPARQLADLAIQIEPHLGVRPDIPDVPSLFRILLRMGREGRTLAVVDEFPYLLPRGDAATNRLLSAIAATLEDELAGSKTKLLLCGSTLSVMASLQEETSPMHGRLTPLVLRPMDFFEASPFLADLDPIDRMERFAITGGMPRYLALLGRGSVREAVCRNVLDRNSALFAEVNVALGQEMISAGTHFSILELLASGPKEAAQLAAPLHVRTQELTPYLRALEHVGLVDRERPLAARAGSRGDKWAVTDPFFAFWFRFVFRFADDLESGLSATDLFDAEVRPALNDHTAPTFEAWCRRWTRSNLGSIAPSVGRWWGRALDPLRKTRTRESEEIDIVGIGRSRVTVVGEAKWRNREMTADALTDLDRYKLPALQQDGYRLATQLRVLLFSRAGYTDGLLNLAASDDRVTLVDVPLELARRPEST